MFKLLVVFFVYKLLECFIHFCKTDTMQTATDPNLVPAADQSQSLISEADKHS